MNWFRSSFLLILLWLSMDSPGQGRIDSDPELFKIRSAASKTDKLIRSYSQGGYRVYPDNNFIYLLPADTDSLNKVLEIKKTAGGIELTTCYYQNGLPTLIAVKRFTGEFDLNADFFDKAILESNRFRRLDSLPGNKFPEANYQAHYFFADQKVRYANIHTKEYTRVDQASDKKKAFELFHWFSEFPNKFRHTYSDIISDGEVHQFLNELKAVTLPPIQKLGEEIWSWSPLINLEDTTNTDLPFYFLNRAASDYKLLNSSFKSEDIKFLKQQLLSLKDSLWQFQYLNQFEAADSTTVKKVVEKSISAKGKLKGNYIYNLSIPLFSLDRKSAIIYQNFYCGALCSSTCIYLYKKDDKGVWKKLLSWSCWSS
jgi:hypothetical protein